MTDTIHLGVNINLVGFDQHAYKTIATQLATINRMNAKQNSLKYWWQISSDIQLSQVHFVINVELPPYLSLSNQPILTNLNLKQSNIIACPHPITTLELMDVLTQVEAQLIATQLSPIQPSPKAEEKTPPASKHVSLYQRGRLHLNNTDKPSPSISHAVTAPSNQKMAHQTLKSWAGHGTAPTKSQTSTAIPTPKQIDDTYNQTPIPQPQPNAPVIATPEAHTAPKTTELATIKDDWLTALTTEQTTVEFAQPHFYLDTKQGQIATTYSNSHELALALLAQTQISHQPVNNIPAGLKVLPLPAVLWSYGLNHPTPETLLPSRPLDDYEWKLKGFPKFGSWETHPMWLFWATFFAQKHRSIYEAAAQGKGSSTHIQQFICAAQFAGLTWHGQALDANKKQQQLTRLQHNQSPHNPNWISRLRDKLQTEDYFKS